MERLTREDDFNIENYTTKELATELDCINKLGQLEDIEDELGIDLTLFFRIMKTENLWWKDRHKKLTHNISSEFISVKPYWSIGAGIMFEFGWNDRNIYAYEDCDVIIKGDESPIGMPHIYLFLRGSDYGKTWALTKEELLCTNKSY